MTRFFWTRDKDLELARRYVDGQSVEAISLALGASQSMVKSRLSTLGVRRRRTKSDVDRHGNAALILGQTLRVAIPTPTDGFAEDFLAASGANSKPQD